MRPSPRPPHLLVFGAGLVALILAVFAWREHPLHFAAKEGRLVAPASPFDPSIVVRLPDGPFQPSAGTAFSVSDRGVWLTARHVVAGCRKIGLMETSGRAALAMIAPDRIPAQNGSAEDIAILTTRGGSPPLSLAPPGLHFGALGFHPGFPQNRPGEVATRLLGRRTLVLKGRAEPGHRSEGRALHVLAWVEAGRSQELKGDLAGLSGAPVLDGSGRVVGVTLAQTQRRRRLYSTSPEAMRNVLARAGLNTAPAASTAPITLQTYQHASDALRHLLSVAQVVCLDH